MAHPYQRHREHHVERERAKHIAGVHEGHRDYEHVYHRARGGKVEHKDEAEDKAIVKSMVKGEALKHGHKGHHRADKRARGGKVKHKGKTVVNVNVAPQGAPHPAMPMPAPAGAAPPMPPPRPPMPAAPPPGGPPMMGPRARGGRTVAKRAMGGMLGGGPTQANPAGAVPQMGGMSGGMSSGMSGGPSPSGIAAPYGGSPSPSGIAAPYHANPSPSPSGITAPYGGAPSPSGISAPYGGGGMGPTHGNPILNPRGGGGGFNYTNGMYAKGGRVKSRATGGPVEPHFKAGVGMGPKGDGMPKGKPVKLGKDAIYAPAKDAMGPSSGTGEGGAVARMEFRKRAAKYYAKTPPAVHTPGMKND